MITKYSYILFITLFLISGCSSSSDETSTETIQKEHFASDQKRALDKAKGVEQLLQDNADQRQREIDEQTKRQ